MIYYSALPIEILIHSIVHWTNENFNKFRFHIVSHKQKPPDQSRIISFCMSYKHKVRTHIGENNYFFDGFQLIFFYRFSLIFFIFRCFFHFASFYVHFSTIFFHFSSLFVMSIVVSHCFSFPSFLIYPVQTHFVIFVQSPQCLIIIKNPETSSFPIKIAGIE